MSKGTTKCGWCLTGDHDLCLPEIKYYDKVWHCTCEKCHDGIPSNNNAQDEQKEEENEELVQEPIQD